MIVTASSSAWGEIKICIWIHKCLEERPPKPKPHGIREPPLILEMMVQVTVVSACHGKPMGNLRPTCTHTHLHKTTTCIHGYGYSGLWVWVLAGMGIKTRTHVEL